MATSKARKPCPGAANTRSRAYNRKQQADITASWIVREIAATITIGMLVSVVMWNCIIGMSESMGPGEGMVVGPIAENDHGR
jgi:hypothetical protein